MTLTVEMHDGRLWLVAHETPGAEHSALLAEFISPDAAEAWKAAQARVLTFAREVGRAGLG